MHMLAIVAGQRGDYREGARLIADALKIRPKVPDAYINLGRMQANAIEAAEQCGILSLPDVAAPRAFARVLAEREPARLLLFCDEDAEVADPIAALARLPRAPLAVLIGPEGGFAEDERAALLRQPNVVRLSLGPRILRADTAAVAALALVQAVVGDWR